METGIIIGICGLLIAAMTLAYTMFDNGRRARFAAKQAVEAQADKEDAARIKRQAEHDKARDDLEKEKELRRSAELDSMRHDIKNAKQQIEVFKEKSAVDLKASMDLFTKVCQDMQAEMKNVSIQIASLGSSFLPRQEFYDRLKDLEERMGNKKEK